MDKVTASAAAQAALRKELVKIMPGYTWTVYKSRTPDSVEATGIRSSGFNRISTVSVVRTEDDGRTVYTVKSAGYGKRAPWAHTYQDGTLARAFRGLQSHYEETAARNRGLANALQIGRSDERATTFLQIGDF